MHKSKNIVHINTKAKRSQTSCFQEVWPFYSLTSVKDGIIAYKRWHVKGMHKTIPFLYFSPGQALFSPSFHTLSITLVSEVSPLQSFPTPLSRVFDTLFAP